MPTAMMHTMNVSVNREPAPMGGVPAEARLSKVEFPAKHQGNINLINTLRNEKARELVGTSNSQADDKASPPVDSPTAPMGMTTTPPALVPEGPDGQAPGNSTADSATASTWVDPDANVLSSDFFDTKEELDFIHGEDEAIEQEAAERDVKKKPYNMKLLTQMLKCSSNRHHRP